MNVGSVIGFMSYQLRLWKRWKEADRRGWAALGKIWGNSLNWNEKKLSREIRRANRIYRLTRGHGNPWRKYKGV